MPTREGEDEGPQGQRQRRAAVVPDDVDDRAVVGDGLAQVEPGHLPDVVEVLADQRAVEAERARRSVERVRVELPPTAALTGSPGATAEQDEHQRQDEPGSSAPSAAPLADVAGQRPAREAMGLLRQCTCDHIMARTRKGPDCAPALHRQPYLLMSQRAEDVGRVEGLLDPCIWSVVTATFLPNHDGISGTSRRRDVLQLPDELVAVALSVSASSWSSSVLTCCWSSRWRRSHRHG